MRSVVGSAQWYDREKEKAYYEAMAAGKPVSPYGGFVHDGIHEARNDEGAG